MPRLKISASQMVAQARQRIKEITTSTLMQHYQNPDWVVVDIRDIRERQKMGYIPGSVHAPRGMVEFWVDPESPYYKPVFGDPDKNYVFYCASGWRSALTVSTLLDMGFAAAHLEQGFSDWVALGGLVEKP